jgi:hypothetical protein
MAFFPTTPKWESKIKTLTILKLWIFIYFSKQAYLEYVKAISYRFQKDLANNVLHCPIEDHLTIVLMQFVIKSQIPNLTLNLSFEHNSCISNLNEQCKGTLGIYTSKTFQWYPGGPIWCLFAFSTNVLNIQDSRMSAIPKVRVHLGVIGVHLLRSPPFVRMHFTLKHTFLASWALALYTLSRTLC